MSKMRDADMPLTERIAAAIERITHGQAAMRVPVEATDPDVVLADCQMEIEKLRKFVGRVLGEVRQYMSDIDGGDVQAWAVECGLLEEWTASEPCGEQCECAEVTDFPTRCYRLTETGKAAMNAAKEQR